MTVGKIGFILAILGWAFFLFWFYAALGDAYIFAVQLADLVGFLVSLAGVFVDKRKNYAIAGTVTGGLCCVFTILLPFLARAESHY